MHFQQCPVYEYEQNRKVIEIVKNLYGKSLASQLEKFLSKKDYLSFNYLISILNLR